MDKAEALNLVYGSLEGVNAMRSPDQLIPMQKDVILAGDEGALDSLALATLILSLESRLRSMTGKDIPLMQDLDMEMAAQDFATPERIAELLIEKIGNA
ncbi:MAG: hypothetical protein JWM33_2797 [Caulobacteraceae bacterium]|nr:hypothetical protein [Caulobacteraceae bacterium]